MHSVKKGRVGKGPHTCLSTSNEEWNVIYILISMLKSVTLPQTKQTWEIFLFLCPNMFCNNFKKYRGKVEVWFNHFKQFTELYSVGGSVVSRLWNISNLPSSYFYRNLWCWYPGHGLLRYCSGHTFPVKVCMCIFTVYFPHFSPGC